MKQALLLFVKGLVVAATGGSISALSDMLSSGQCPTGKALGAHLGVGAMIAVGGYLKQSPLAPKQ